MNTNAIDQLNTLLESSSCGSSDTAVFLTVHLGTCGIAAGAGRTLQAVRAFISSGNVQSIDLKSSGCAGLCSCEPMVSVSRNGEQPVMYLNVTEDKVNNLFDCIKGVKTAEECHLQTITHDDPFYLKQQTVVFVNRGLIDPESLDDALASGAYEGLASILDNMDPAEVIAEITRSGLRGRGGGGFPAGVKWSSCVNASERTGGIPVIVCNADEGDPGAYMDRSILESDPHSIIEGMAIGAYAIGADEGYIYIRKEYPLAMEILENAIRQSHESNLLGKGILGTDFSFDLVIHRGAGAFVCGESSALMISMSGMPGEPRAKYIHTVESGYKGRPTVLNNVETLANIPRIITKGAKWFASIGTGDVSENPWNGSSGTKVFSLVGDIKKAGLVEIPMGITLREIIFDIGGGIPGGRKFKAVQTGGPSGGVLPADKLDLPVDFDTLTDAGSMMGSGGMVVMDDETCMIQIAKYFVDFLKDESCGKCTPCREGLVALGTILQRIISGDGRQGDIELLEEYGQNMCETSLCALGQTAANPVLSTIEYFRDEYEEHIRDGKCGALKCKALIEFRINPENCTGCTICARNCPVDAIEGSLKEPHVIDQEKCIRCGVCKEVCNFNAVEVL
ncbi:MAG: 4Fe-4S binding protein [Candidatus Aegiribacteria sp.]|nr:4Fe-4S binding protein [Candidatus Aegiribacteria sp.]